MGLSDGRFSSKYTGISLKDVEKMSTYARYNIEDAFKERCRYLDTPPDNVIRGFEGLQDDKVFYMISFIVAMDTLAFILNNLEDVATFMKRSLDKAPFYGAKPLDKLQRDPVFALNLRFYCNGMLADFLKFYTLPEKFTAIPPPAKEDIYPED